MLCVGLVLAAASAFAADRDPEGRLVAPGALQIDGIAVSCGATPALISRTYPDYGASRPGLIILNPKRLQPLTPAARLLVYYHECAHQYVGRSELDADCWAVQQARRDGRLGRGDLRDACAFIDALPANERHPPGRLRCAHMMRCFADTYRVRASSDKLPPSAPDQAVNSGFANTHWPPLHDAPANR